MKNPAVSILIPAYNPSYFKAALASACAQTFGEIEIVVADDSDGEAIAQAVQDQRDPRIRYLRNASRLGFHGNFTQCFAEARGPLIKYLNDDDLLAPDCVERLAGLMENYGPGVTLATSRRLIIDGNGAPQADIPANPQISWVSGRLDGHALVDFVLGNSANFIGEPTTVLFRKAAVSLEDGSLFRWYGTEYHCLADLSLWVRLLANGDAAYTPDRLSAFRVHPDQEQEKPEVWKSCWTERIEIVLAARKAGHLGSVNAWAAARDAARQRLQKVIASLPEASEIRGELVSALGKLDAAPAASG